MMETNAASSRSRPDGSTWTACCDGPRACRRWGVTSPSLGEGRVENLVVLFCSTAGLTQNTSKGAVYQSLGLKRRTVVNCATRDSLPPPLSPAGSSGLPKSTSSCPFVEPVKGCKHSSPCFKSSHAGLSQVSSRVPVFLPHGKDQVSVYAVHPDPAPCRHRPGHHRPRAGSLYSTSLPLRGYVGGPVGPAGMVSRSLVKLALPSPPL